MPREAKRNLHVPLPEGLYRRLRSEAARVRRPATEIAREAIDRWLADMQRSAIHAGIMAYAESVAGTREDLDPELERASVEHLLGPRSRSAKMRRKRP